jgi:ELWxxDGT repeat protein
MQVVFATSLGLVVSDGTVAGTSIIKAAVSGAGGFDAIGRMASLGADVLFVADAGGGPGPAGGFNNLWKTDGTANGTTLVATLPDDTSYSDPPTEFSGANLYDLTSLGTTAVFEYSDYASDIPTSELWATNGTSSGTAVLSASTTAQPSPDGLLNDGQLVYVDYSGVEVTDGTPAGTALLKAGVFTTNFPFEIGSLGSIVVFSLPGDQLWRSDGTPDGTVLVTDFGGPTASDIGSFQALGDKALFTFGDNSPTPGLWVTDGTTAGTFEIPGITNPVFGAVAGNYEILSSTQGLVATDGTINGTSIIAPNPLNSSGADPGGFSSPLMATLGNDVIFAAGVANTGGGPEFTAVDQLWETDGTASGTHLIVTLPDPNGTDFISSMTSTGDHVLFVYPDSSGNDAVWTTDGTSSGTSILLDDAITTLAAGAVADLTCFAAGTLIETECGPMAVEKLATGDLVRSHTGELRRVRWIGHRHIDPRRHPNPERIWPVRIATGAFAHNVPRRDLWLSPNHAVFVNDVLIPIKHLINGTSIAQVPRDPVDYYHIELTGHDVLLAEGLPVESYLDVGDRTNFDNGGTALRLHPDFSARMWDAKGCAPLIVTGPIVAALRFRLLQRATEIAGGKGRVARAA